MMKPQYILLLTLFLVSCRTKKDLTADELKAFVLNEENGLHKTVEKNGIRLEMLYRPKDLIIAQEADDAMTWQELEKELDSLHYFVLKLSRNGQEIENAYVSYPDKFTSVINYLSGRVGEDLKIVVKDITYPVEGTAFSQSFGTANASSILIVTNNKYYKKEPEVTIVFDDTEFGIGRTEFSFKTTDLELCPHLKM